MLTLFCCVGVVVSLAVSSYRINWVLLEQVVLIYKRTNVCSICLRNLCCNKSYAFFMEFPLFCNFIPCRENAWADSCYQTNWSPRQSCQQG